MNTSNVEKLAAANVINKDNLSEDELKAINALSEQEVEQMISIHDKVKGQTGKPVGFPL